MISRFRHVNVVFSCNCLSLDNSTSPWKRTVEVGCHQVNKLVLTDISVGATGGAGATSFAVHIPDHSPSIHATLDRSRQRKKIKSL